MTILLMNWSQGKDLETTLLVSQCIDCVDPGDQEGQLEGGQELLRRLGVSWVVMAYAFNCNTLGGRGRRIFANLRSAW